MAVHDIYFINNMVIQVSITENMNMSGFSSFSQNRLCENR